MILFTAGKGILGVVKKSNLSMLWEIFSQMLVGAPFPKNTDTGHAPMDRHTKGGQKDFPQKSDYLCCGTIPLEWASRQATPPFTSSKR